MLAKFFVLFLSADLYIYSKTCVKRPLNRQNKGLNDNLKFNEGRKYCRMLSGSILQYFLTCIKRFSVLKTNFGIFLEWPLKTGFTV